MAPLWKSGLSGPLRYLAHASGIEGAAAEADHPPPPIGDGEDDAVAEAVVGGRTVFGGDEQARLHQLGRARTFGDQVVLQSGAAGRRIAQAEALPLRLRQGALVEIAARGLAGRASELGREPRLRLDHPVGQALAARLLLCGARIGGGQ